MRYITGFLIVFAVAAGAVNVQIPLDDVTVNLSALLQTGYDYRFEDDAERRTHVGSGYFAASLYRIGFDGDIGERIFYRAEYGSFPYARNFIGYRITDGFSIRAGQDVIPFTVDGQLLPEEYIATSPSTVGDNAANNGLGLRGDFKTANANPRWGLSAGFYPYVFPYADFLDTFAGRTYLEYSAGKAKLELGISGLERKEYRYRIVGEYPRLEVIPRYLEAPRAAGDATVSIGGFSFRAEYSRYFVDGVLIYNGGDIRDAYFKNFTENDYYGIAAYRFSLPWRFLQAIQPYGRYERHEPAIIHKGPFFIAYNKITGGFDSYFLGNNLMLRADYTRVLEDALPMKNDEIRSHIQLYL